MRISYWISDVFSADLDPEAGDAPEAVAFAEVDDQRVTGNFGVEYIARCPSCICRQFRRYVEAECKSRISNGFGDLPRRPADGASNIDHLPPDSIGGLHERSEQQTSELQPLTRISYAVFCLK